MNKATNIQGLRGQCLKYTSNHGDEFEHVEDILIGHEMQRGKQAKKNVNKNSQNKHNNAHNIFLCLSYTYNTFNIFSLG